MRRYLNALLLTITASVAMASPAVTAQPYGGIDHSLWQQILDLHLMSPAEGRNQHLIDYSGITKSSRPQLDRYIDVLSQQQYWIYPEEEQQAYWINLYNALTVRLISDFYPIKSIDQIQFSSGSYSDVPLVTVQTTPLSLSDIETIVASSFRDSPTLHFAMSCGTKSCPGLAPTVYRGVNLETSLEEQMQRYLSDRQNVRFEGDRLIVPSSLQIYQAVHREDTTALLRRVAYYAPPETALRLLGFSGDVEFWEDRGISLPQISAPDFSSNKP